MVETIVLAKARHFSANGRARMLRQICGLSLAEVASQVGVSSASVCNWERGLTKPTGERAVAYLAVLAELARDAPQFADVREDHR